MLFIWGEQHGYPLKNYAEGLQIKDSRSEHEEREGFTEEGLRNIFDPSRYIAECKGIWHRYWPPLMSLLSGGRLNEICQLHLKDIVQVNGIDCFSFNDDAPDKRLKTKASKRTIPIHHRLIDLGFLEYINKLRATKHERVFPMLSLGRDGYQKKVSEWFSKYKQSLGFQDTVEVFHSFRHTFDDYFNQSLTHETVLIDLMGHERIGESHKRYANKLNPEVLQKEGILKLDFNLEWERLKIWKGKL